MRAVSTFRERDRRDMPAYSLREAAHYLRLPTSTLRQWVCGRKGDGKPIPGVIAAPEHVGRSIVLSFNNLVECHILASLRREHEVPLQNVRRALRYVQRELKLPRPLLQQQFETDGADLFVKQLGSLVNVSREGQLGARELLSASLRRVERGADGLPLKLYPFPGAKVSSDAPRHVVVDPAVSFGRPVLAGTGIPTEEIAARLRAGEAPTELAEDFNVSEAQIISALICESRDTAA